MTDQTVPAPDGAQLKANALGLADLLFFVFSAQAPLTGIVGASALAVGLGNGAGAPGAYLLVELVIIVFSVGFTTIVRHIDASGGFYSIIRAGFGRRMGGGASWIALLIYTCVQAAMYGLLGASAEGLLSTAFGLDVPWWLIVMATMAVIWFLGARGIEVGARILAVLVLLEVLLLFVFALAVFITMPAVNIDVAASFSPDAILQGTPAVAVLFAIASMFGFELTAVYSAETRDPHRTVPQATYLVVVLIALFFAFMLFAVVVSYGADGVQAAALQTLETDPALFVLTPMVNVLGNWAGLTASVLLITSLIAGILAFHNLITRYFHSMSRAGTLPKALQRTNRFHAPANASALQTAIAILVVAPFALLQMSPTMTLFTWLSGVTVAGIMVLCFVSSLAVVRYFRLNRVEPSIFKTIIMPIVAALLILGIIVIVVSNFALLTASDPSTAIFLLLTVPVFFLIGVLSVGRNAPDIEPVHDPLTDTLL